MTNPALKLDILICHFAYGGNGGVAMESPDLREWEVQAILKMKKDPRIGEIHLKTISDTPITMTRNRAVRHAREVGAHLLMMIDSDQSPNKHKGEPWFRDFFDEAFDAIYAHYGKGPICVGAPYCGPPTGIENVYVFQFSSFGTGRGDETRFTLDQYTRAEAAKMSGVQECAALPTGFILFDMRCFELIEPSPLSNREILQLVQCGEMTVDEGVLALDKGYFHYEWPDQYADQKDSTEDVVATRNIALAGMAKLGYNPVFCAWNSWVGHHKPWNVGKPAFYGVEQIASSFQRTVLENRSNGERIVEASQYVKLPKGMKKAIVLNERRTSDWREVHETPLEDIAALQELVKEVLAHKHKCRVLEVGTWLGNTAIAMADAGAEVHCVDTWNGTPSDLMGVLAKAAGSPDAVYEEFLKRIGPRYNKSIFPCRQESLKAAAYDWPKKFDIIFIDADHTKAATLADIEAWKPHLNDDGIICGHDYMDGFQGVIEAVNEHFGVSCVLQPGHREGNVRILGRTVWSVIPALEPVA